MSGGWVKVDRTLANHDLWLAEPFSRGQAWIDLILLASYRDTTFWKRGILVEQKRGQIAISIKGLAARWQWSRGRVRRFLDDLKALHQIEHQNNNVTTLITLTNYDRYQGEWTPDKTPDGHQTDTIKKVKKVKNRGRKIPPEFSITSSMQDWATNKGLAPDSVQTETEKFIDHFLSKGDTRKDWSAAWRNWIRKAIEYKPELVEGEKSEWI